eukprot:scaffold90276_cov38-Attheya_sp.AAC.1
MVDRTVGNGRNGRVHEESLVLSVSHHDGVQADRGVSSVSVSVSVSMESVTQYSDESLDREAQRWKHLLLRDDQTHNEWGDVTRLTIQVHSHTHNDYYAPDAPLVRRRRRGPAGVSIEAAFRVNDDDNDDSTHTHTHTPSNHTVRDRYEALLRAIVGQRLVCAPLDGIRIRRNHHPTSIVEVEPPRNHSRRSSQHDENHETIVIVSTTLSGESGEPFCTESIQSFLDLYPKHCAATIDTGLFMGAHTTTTLSNVLLGVAPNSDSTQPPHHRSLWIELSLLPQQDMDQQQQDQQHKIIQVKQGVHYSVSFLPDARRQSFSLADAVLGGQALHPAKSRQLQPCPLVDSTLISTQLFPSVEHNHSQFHLAQNSHPQHPSKEDDPSSSSDSMVTYNVVLQKEKNENSVNWNQPWITWDDSSSSSMHPNEQEPNSDTTDSAGSRGTIMWAVEQWVDTARGVTNAGTLVSMLRNAGTFGSTHVSVQSHLALDIMTPILHTVQLQLYQGNHAGQEGFDPRVPPNNKSGDGGNNVTRWSLTDMPGFKMTVMGKDDVLLEWSVTLPPDSSLVTRIEYDAVFPSFENFPADPNRGVHVPPLVAHFSDHRRPCRRHHSHYLPANNDEDCTSSFDDVTLYSSSPLLVPPVPDTSMPFNVISLTSTFFAFLLGTMLNLMGRKSSRTLQRLLLGNAKKEPRTNPLQRLVAKIKSKILVFSRTTTNDPDAHPDQQEPSQQETPIATTAKKENATCRDEDLQPSNKKGRIT